MAGCNPEREPDHKSFTLTDDLGVKHTFSRQPESIISLAPNITETIFALHADSLLIGVTDFCDYPPEAKSKRSVGNYLSPDLESIVSLKPDLAMIYVTNPSGTTYKSLASSGIKIFACNPVNIAGIRKMIKDIGIISGRAMEADSIIRVIDQSVADSVPHSQMPPSFIVISVNPLMTAGSTSYISEVCELSGYSNIYEELGIEYPLIDAEDLHNKRPERVILPADTSNIAKVIELKSEFMRATKSKFSDSAFVIVDDDILYRPGPRITEAIASLRSKRTSANQFDVKQ